MTVRDATKAGPVGRGARLVLAVGLAVITVPVYLEAGATYVTTSLLLTLGLAVAYVGLHGVFSRYLAALNRWMLAAIAVLPVVLMWALGQGGGPLFGQGEGATAALSYLTISFLVDAIRGRAGCEVMALPSLLTGTRTDVPCVVLCPIDHVEAARAPR